MKKKLLSLLLMGGMLIGLTSPAFAQTYYGGKDWSVTFSQKGAMDCNFKTADINDAVKDMQPGDSVVLKVALKNENSETTNWYMSNKVISSLEDKAKAASGGVYTYRLVYTNKSGKSTTLLQSSTVGGDTSSKAGKGLHQATDALEDYFYLDTLAKNGTGSISLEIGLDGETMGNGYQNTLADLQMGFAVEMQSEANKAAERIKSVNTGDDNNPIPYIAAAGAAGVCLLALAVRRLRRDNGQ